VFECDNLREWDSALPKSASMRDDAWPAVQSANSE